MSPAQLTPAVSERDHSAGPDDAPVVLVEFGDYECPNCGAAYPIVKAIQARLGDRLRFVFRNFPLRESHPHAQQAAEAAEAAAAQDRFWEMHDTIFEHQQALTGRDLVGYAARLGLDADRVARELEGGVHAARVHEDFLSGVRSGVNGTPTFFIDGRRYDGDWRAPGELEDALAAAAGAGRAEPVSRRR